MDRYCFQCETDEADARWLNDSFIWNQAQAWRDDCDICGLPPVELGEGRVNVHDHETGELFGLVCRRCCPVGPTPESVIEALKQRLEDGIAAGPRLKVPQSYLDDWHQRRDGKKETVA